MKTVIQIILLAVIIVLSYFLYESIQGPIRFNKEKKIREDATIARLKDIRTAEIAFKSEYDRFTGSFDTLIAFLKADSFRVVQKIGSIPDSLIEAGMTEKQAMKKGLIKRDTIRISVLDSLFKPGFFVDSLRYVPFTKNYQFELGAGDLATGSKVTVRVFEAKVLYDILLAGLDRQLVINYKEERKLITGYPGLRVGSLTEPTNNAGNWE
jgi:hypothetical protein